MKKNTGWRGEDRGHREVEESDSTPTKFQVVGRKRGRDEILSGSYLGFPFKGGERKIKKQFRKGPKRNLPTSSRGVTVSQL